MNGKLFFLALNAYFRFMSEKEEFAKRLREAMTEAGYALRPVVLEREFNTRYYGSSVTLQAVRRWLRGEAIPSQDKLQVLAEWLKVEPHALRFGVTVQHSVQEHRKRWGDGLDYAEKEVFDAFLALPAAQRKVVREVILTFAKAHQDEARVAPPEKK